jgi:hypothetical protein
MKFKDFSVFLIVIAMLTICSGCKHKQTDDFEENTPTNANIEHPDIQVLMHNPAGMRIEYNITKQQLELWISPQAGKDNDYWIRNFSNRDDHTRVFDKISFPRLSVNDYKKVDYDPWHSIIHFSETKLHIATVFDKPVVMLWFENDEWVDFKSDKQDAIRKRTSDIFHMTHPDRGLDFSFVAKIIGGEFQHQLQTDRGRSTYARAKLTANNPLFVGSELTSEDVEQMVMDMADEKPKELLAKTNERTDQIVENGKIELQNWDSLQKMIDFNKRIWVSSQDLSGALHASIKRIYYLIWVREGGLACPWIGYSGWMYPLENWLEFQMENPTEIDDEGPGGRFFGQLVNGKITKWQEDGAFYAIWSAFTHWTQSGNDEFVTGENLELLRDAMDWLERYCYDEEKGLFYRRFYCETPLYNSRDFGWDNAVGKPVYGWDAPPYKGEKIEKTYDIYINLLNYSVYCMLESMSSNAGLANEYGEKAQSLAENMRFLFDAKRLPLYGKVYSIDGEEIISEEYGMDKTDYIWALTCPPFYPDYVDIYKYRNNLFEDLLEKKDHYFLAAYFSILGSLNMSQVSQKDVKWAIDYAAKECYVPWENLPLAGSMVEMSGYYPPGHGHQIRPQMFTMGAWFGAMGNLAIHRLPYGLAIQPSQLVEHYQKYQYKDKTIDLFFQGKGNISSIKVNGEPVKFSLQIPEVLLTESTNKIEIELAEADNNQFRLNHSSAVLNQVKLSNDTIQYYLNTTGNCILYLENLNNKNNLQIVDQQGRDIFFEVFETAAGLSKISFSYSGKCVLIYTGSP